MKDESNVETTVGGGSRGKRHDADELVQAVPKGTGGHGTPSEYAGDTAQRREVHSRKVLYRSLSAQRV